MDVTDDDRSVDTGGTGANFPLSAHSIENQEYAPGVLYPMTFTDMPGDGLTVQEANPSDYPMNRYMLVVLLQT